MCFSAVAAKSEACTAYFVSAMQIRKVRGLLELFTFPTIHTSDASSALHRPRVNAFRDLLGHAYLSLIHISEPTRLALI
eukprot:6014618-Alexandrium_andersonii.AAC.1